MEISRHDTDRIIGTKRRVREANLSSVLTAFNDTANDSYVAVRASLEKLAMSRVGLTDQHWASASINNRSDWDRVAKFEP